MAGRIRDEDIVAVRERAQVDDVVGEYVTLRRAGSGSLKGLCPFHDEKTPSFHVTPARGMYHCFGCGEGGDVFAFLQRIDGLTFPESVERLADRVGVQLRYEDDAAGTAPRQSREQRTRLVEAHRLAANFYAEALTSPEALAGRTFLDERGFDREAAAMFGVGYAPRGGEVLRHHLRQRGFTDEELLAAGLVAQGRGTPYDRFRGRLVWPI
ncbi:MAG TPA: DNA primase, partial [Jiangellaceae bacterium]|nr:DNA primase [Jiangellaceae bacterium]